MQPPTVHIIGAGVAGMTAYLAMKRRGMNAHVLESSSALRRTGSVITLFPPALQILDTLGVGPLVRSYGQTLEHLAFHASSGARLGGLAIDAMRAPTVSAPVYIERARLMDALYSRAQAGVRFNVRCNQVRQAGDTVSVHDIHGRRVARGDIVVGADGISSPIRAQLVQDGPPRYSGQRACFGISHVAHPVLPARTVFFIIGQGMYCWMSALDRTRVSWLVFLRERHLPGPRHSLSTPQLSRLFRGWNQRFRRVISAADQPVHKTIAIRDRPASPVWGRGRVTLLGDAIHPSVPDLGQGACQAIESADTLARCLTDNRPSRYALRRYESLRKQRTAYMTSLSWLINRLGIIENPATCRIRNMCMSAFSSMWAYTHLRAIGALTDDRSRRSRATVETGRWRGPPADQR